MKGGARSEGEERRCDGKRGDRSGEGDDGRLQPYNEAEKRTYS